MNQVQSEEDFVEYRVYSAEWEGPHDDVKLKARAFLFKDFLHPFLHDYIWQKDDFELRVSSPEDPSNHLWGKTRFGDNIEDEWFIVFLLFELSNHFPELVITIFDNDGDFLLIEAAEVLPKWLKPENSVNRVFIHKGKLHIIPLPKSPAELSVLPNPPTLHKSIEIIRKQVVKTEASELIQNVISNRIQGFGTKSNYYHGARCILPLDVAHVLKHGPHLVSPAVEAFYYRDMDSMKYCQHMMKFNPQNRVLVMVKFTRCLYAQLLKQKFHPPKAFGPSSSLSPSHPDSKAMDLGVKLACGFEMMYQVASRRREREKPRRQPENLDITNVDHDAKWQGFEKLLSDQGYYENSLGHGISLEAAKQKAKMAFLDFSFKKEQDLAEEIDQILRIPHSEEDFPTEIGKEDDDAWLEIKEDQLEKILNERTQFSLKEPKKEAATRFDQVVSQMKQFMDKKSTWEGADSEEEEGELFDSEDSEEDGGEDFETLQKIMAEMDSELAGNFSLGQEFERIEEQEGPLQDQDMDYNLLKNLLESYSSQQGEAGPVTNILSQMKSHKK